MNKDRKMIERENDS